MKRIISITLAVILTILPLRYSLANNDQPRNLEEQEEGRVKITYANKVITNESVEIKFMVEDDGDSSQASGVERLVYLDGEDEQEITLTGEDVKVGEYLVTSNGVYSFKAYDVAGNYTTALVTIENIDKTSPTLELSAPEELTNQNVTIVAKAKDNIEVNKILFLGLDDESLEEELELKSKEDGKEASREVSRNGIYKFKVIDTAGNETIKSIDIGSINKNKPIISADYNDSEQEWTNQDITVTVSTDKGELKEETYTFTENGEYTFTAKDEWGNIGELSITVTKIDKSPPIINIEVKNKD